MASSPTRRGTSRDANGGSSSANAGKDLKDNFVPRFDNTTTTYAEWRRRVTLYARKLELQGRKSEIALNVLSVLEGPSWTQCEDLDLHELEKESGLDILLKCLDRQWAYDAKVEMPTHFEQFFFKLRRKKDQSILEYTTEFHQTLRQVSKHKVDLPEEITGWMSRTDQGTRAAHPDQHRLDPHASSCRAGSLPDPRPRSSPCTPSCTPEEATAPRPMEEAEPSLLGGGL